MGWFGNTTTLGSKYGSEAYGYASRQIKESPTIFTAILTIIACITSVWSGMETAGTMAGPFITALIFLGHNIHVRSSHRNVKDALEEVRTARNEIDFSRRDLRENTLYTVDAAQSAAQAAKTADRIEALARALDKKIDALHAKG